VLALGLTPNHYLSLAINAALLKAG